MPMLVCRRPRIRWFLCLCASLTAMTLLQGGWAEMPKSDKSGVEPSSAAADYGKLPLSFEANQGQSDAAVKFLSQGNGYVVFLTDSAAVLSLTKTNALHHAVQPGVPFTKDAWGAVPTPIVNKSAGPLLVPDSVDEDGAEARSTETIRMDLVGAATERTSASGEDRLPGVSNYFLGSDPSRWLANVPTYAKVKFAGVYRGIDLVYYGNQRQLEYDFVVAPKADPGVIRLKFTGAQKLQLSLEGDLEIEANEGNISFRKPLLYQVVNGQRQPVEGSFEIASKDSVVFRVGAYDAERELVIDPTLAYSTYLGGGGYKITSGPDCCGDYGNAIAVDQQGNAYITGQTGSSNFPVTTGAYQTTDKFANTQFATNDGNVFVTKLNAMGTALVYSTYLGGTGEYSYSDQGEAIAVDAAGDAYVTGNTGSSNFPVTPDAYQKTNLAAKNGAYTAFVTKLNPTGTALLFSTYLGGSGLANCCGPSPGDSGNGIAIDNASDVFVGGTTYSTDFPFTAGAFQKVNNAAVISKSNLFVTKLNAEGSQIIYSTYLGGKGYNEGCCYFFSSGDTGTSLAVDGTGSPYIAGLAFSDDYPVSSDAFQKTNLANNGSNIGTSYNAVVTKLNPTFSMLEYSTYLGGTANATYGDAAKGIAVDPACYAYVTGYAGSANFPVTKGAFQYTAPRSGSSFSAFVTKLNPTGSGLEYSTYIGGSMSGSGDIANGIRVDAAGHAYVVGTAQSTNFPLTTNAFQPTNLGTGGSSNAFITQLNAAGSGLIYSSYLGGSGYDGSGDVGSAIALDMAGNPYITGHTVSSNFPVLPNPGAFQSTMPDLASGNQGSGNAFVAKFGIGSGAVLSATTTTVTADADPSSADVKTTFTAYVAQGTVCGFAPTGKVSFSLDGKVVATDTLDDTGHAAYSTTALTVGTHNVVVTYSGDMRYKASSGSLTETIDAAPTKEAYSSGNGQSAVYGATYAKPLVVKVTDATGGVAPGVPVTFSGTGLKFAAATVMSNASGLASATAIAARDGYFDGYGYGEWS